MSRTILHPKGAPPSLAPYSPGIRADGTIYTAGIVAIDDQGKTVGVGEVKVQTRHVLETIAAILEAGGASLKDVAMSHIFVRDYADYPGMNEVYSEFFASDPPARYCIKTDLVRDDWLVEIACVAHVPQTQGD